MKRIGIDLGVLDGQKAPLPLDAPVCPGGLLRISRYDYDMYVQGGERFETPRQDIPGDGLGSARIRCGHPVARMPKTAAGNDLFYGLCFSCSGAEAKNRADLRDRQKATER